MGVMGVEGLRSWWAKWPGSSCQFHVSSHSNAPSLQNYLWQSASLLFLPFFSIGIEIQDSTYFCVPSYGAFKFQLNARLLLVDHKVNTPASPWPLPLGKNGYIFASVKTKVDFRPPAEPDLRPAQNPRPLAGAGPLVRYYRRPNLRYEPKVWLNCRILSHLTIEKWNFHMRFSFLEPQNLSVDHDFDC